MARRCKTDYNSPYYKHREHRSKKNAKPDYHFRRQKRIDRRRALEDLKLKDLE